MSLRVKSYCFEDLFPLEALEMVKKEGDFTFRAIRKVAENLRLTKRAQRALRSFLISSRLKTVESPWVLVTINGKKFLARTKASLEKEKEIEEENL